MSISSYRHPSSNRNSGSLGNTSYDNGKWYDNLPIFSFFGNLFNKWSGREMTGSEVQAAQINSEEADKARQFQEDMYVKHGSLQAKIQEAKESGVNPMFVATGGSAIQPAPSSSAQGSASSSGGSGFESVLSALLGIPSMISNIKNNQAQRSVYEAEAENLRSETRKNDAQTFGQQIQNEINFRTKDLQILSYSLKNEETRAKIADTLKGVDLKQSQIEINGVQVDYIESSIEVNASIVELNGSQLALNTQKVLESKAAVAEIQSKIRLNNANATQIESLTPLLEEFYDAQIALMDAQNGKTVAEKEKIVEEKALVICKKMAENDLLDNDYYKNLADEQNANADTAWSEAGIAKLVEKDTPSKLSDAHMVAIAQATGEIISSVADVVSAGAKWRGKRQRRTKTHRKSQNVPGNFQDTEEIVVD